MASNALARPPEECVYAPSARLVNKSWCIGSIMDAAPLLGGGRLSMLSTEPVRTQGNITRRYRLRWGQVFNLIPLKFKT
jgi:hypothetical protein